MTINAIAVSKRIVMRFIAEWNLLEAFSNSKWRDLAGAFLLLGVFLLIRKCQTRTLRLSDTRPQQGHNGDGDGLQLQRKVYQRMRP